MADVRKVIPREGVESGQDRRVYGPLPLCVIPREGVESLSCRLQCLRLLHQVIPREGVESIFLDPTDET